MLDKYIMYNIHHLEKTIVVGVAIKTKLRGRIESNEVEDDVPYQVDEMSHVNEVIEVKRVSRFHHIEGHDEELEQEDEDEEEE